MATGPVRNCTGIYGLPRYFCAAHHRLVATRQLLSQGRSNNGTSAADYLLSAQRVKSGVTPLLFCCVKTMSEPYPSDLLG
jgi:hypothetical protein